MTYQDDIVDEMMKAARRAASHEDAVWKALYVLEKEGGYISLPLDGGASYHAKASYLAKGARRRRARLGQGGTK